jgi:hypothetical protein
MKTATLAPVWRYLRRIIKILRMPGGPEALNRHLDLIDREVRPPKVPKYCSQCGSTDFEPTSSRADGGRVQVLKIRCRACGHVDPF